MGTSNQLMPLRRCRHSGQLQLHWDYGEPQNRSASLPDVAKTSGVASSSANGTTKKVASWKCACLTYACRRRGAMTGMTALQDTVIAIAMTGMALRSSAPTMAFKDGPST